jgi:hypothetical protein
LDNAAILGLSVVFLAGGFLFGRGALTGRKLTEYMVTYYASLFFGLYLVTRVVAPGELAGEHAPNDAWIWVAATFAWGSYFAGVFARRWRERVRTNGEG